MYHLLTEENLPTSLLPFPEDLAAAIKNTDWKTYCNHIFFIIYCVPFRNLYSDHTWLKCLPVNPILFLGILDQRENVSLQKFCRNLPGNYNAQYAAHMDCLPSLPELPSESTVKHFGRFGLSEALYR